MADTTLHKATDATELIHGSGATIWHPKYHGRELVFASDGEAVYYPTRDAALAVEAHAYDPGRRGGGIPEDANKYWW